MDTNEHIEKLVRKYWRTRLHTYNCLAEDKITVDEWLAELKKRKAECAICGTKENLTIDHIIPLRKGGRNIISNIQLLCATCNQKKGSNPSLKNVKITAYIRQDTYRKLRQHIEKNFQGRNVTSMIVDEAIKSYIK